MERPKLQKRKYGHGEEDIETDRQTRGRWKREGGGREVFSHSNSSISSCRVDFSIDRVHCYTPHWTWMGCGEEREEGMKVRGREECLYRQLTSWLAKFPSVQARLQVEHLQMARTHSENTEITTPSHCHTLQGHHMIVT